jgi:sulfur carrier protein
VTVKVNGKERPVEPGTTVAELLEHLGVASDGVAVAIGNEVVPRTRHPDRRLEDGDQVEIVRAVGGG